MLCCLPEPGCGLTNKNRECILCPHWRLVLRAAAFLLHLPEFLNLTPLTLSPEMKNGSLGVRISILHDSTPRCGALPDHMVVTKRSLCDHALQTLGAYLCVNNLSFYISAGIQHFMSCILSPVNCFLFSISKDFASPHIIVSFPHEQSFYCTFYWTKIGLWCYVCLCVHGGDGFLESGDLLQTLFQ